VVFLAMQKRFEASCQRRLYAVEELAGAGQILTEWHGVFRDDLVGNLNLGRDDFRASTLPRK
jgi:hypothetical protein